MNAFHCDVRLGQGAVRDFLAPQCVLNGDGAAAKTGDALRTWGVPPGRALVICDKFMFDTGAVSPVLDGLRSAGFQVDVFGEVMREPTLDDAAAAAARARAIGRPPSSASAAAARWISPRSWRCS